MTATEFITHVEVKLNRIDTNAYEDVRPEEVIFFANNALKALTLAFDLGMYSQLVDKSAINTYLASLIVPQTEVNLTANAYTLPATVLKFKDMEVNVTKGTETAWCTTRFLDNNNKSIREDNPFTKSFPDTPVFRLINSKIQFDVSDFTCNKIRFEYLKTPTVIEDSSTLTYPFMEELEDKTVTLILENLEAQRLQTQPVVSKS